MHFCTCEIRIGGDLRNVVARDHFAPVSYPEVGVLQEVHGDDAILNVKPFIDVEQDARAERERLRLIYGNRAVEAVFGGGRNPGNMPMQAPNAKLGAPPEKWFNPLDPDPAKYDVEPVLAKTEAPKPRVTKDF